MKTNGAGGNHVLVNGVSVFLDVPQKKKGQKRQKIEIPPCTFFFFFLDLWLV